jgi:NADPH2:quinone reductase
MMKAIRVHKFGDPEVMHVEEVPDPRPGPGQVVVKIKAIGINPVDTYIRSGIYHIKPQLPYTPGTDAAGRIESIGEGVDHVSIGDRVYTAGSISGTYAQQTLCDAAKVHALPESISFAQGAGINTPYSASYYALFVRAKAVPGEVVLIHGATGGVGVAALQWARGSGLTIIATGGSEAGRRMLAEQGARHVLDHRSPNHQKEVLTLTNGHGVDIILEMLANINLGTDLNILAKDGRVVIIGSRGPVEINPRDAMGRNASILGMLVAAASEREIFSIHAAIGAGLENHILRPVVGQELPLAEASRAHRLLMESSAYGKIVLIP